MAIPYRGNTGLGTYFITSAACQRKSLFQSETMASLLLNVLFDYRDNNKYLLHEFVIMPNHFHLLLTPTDALERALQLIKGGFSFRAKRELGFGSEIWESSFHDRRIRDENEFLQFREYIHCNPVKAGLSETPETYPYCSSAPGYVLDAIPQRLKPMSQAGSIAALKRCATQKHYVKERPIFLNSHCRNTSVEFLTAPRFQQATECTGFSPGIFSSPTKTKTIFSARCRHMIRSCHKSV